MERPQRLEKEGARLFEIRVANRPESRSENARMPAYRPSFRARTGRSVWAKSAAPRSAVGGARRVHALVSVARGSRKVSWRLGLSQGVSRSHRLLPVDRAPSRHSGLTRPNSIVRSRPALAAASRSLPWNRIEFELNRQVEAGSRRLGEGERAGSNFERNPSSARGALSRLAFWRGRSRRGRSRCGRTAEQAA